MTKLRVGFDAKRLFCNKEGLGSYARTLLIDLQSLYPQHEYHLYTPKFNKSIDTSYFKDKSKFTIHKPDSSSFLWRYSKVTDDLIRDEIDIYIGLSNELPRGLSKAGIKSVLVVHDLLYKFFPEQFKFFDRLLIDHKLKHAINEADSVVAISKHTAADLSHTFSNSEHKTSVIYQSVNNAFRAIPVEQATGDYFLCVGSINKRKNLKLLIKAYDHIPDKQKQPVTIVGTGKRYKEELLDMIKERGYEHLFKFEGYVTNQTLVQHYNKAIALIFPSQYEGFGIPILESLSMHVPVISSSMSSLPEVIGQHGIVIDYSDDVALANAIKLMSKKESKLNYLRGLDDHLHNFSPELICREYISIIEQLTTSE